MAKEGRGAGEQEKYDMKSDPIKKKGADPVSSGSHLSGVLGKG